MHSTLIDLQAFELVCISGEDSKTFLQGQVSCNMDELSENHSLSGAICNLKGRVITDFRIFEYQSSCFLQVKPDVAATVKAVLDKYIVFAKADCQIVNKRFARWGLIGNDAHHVLEQLFGQYPAHDNDMLSQQQHLIIKIPGLIPRFEIWQDSVNVADNKAVLEGIRQQSSSAGASLWTVEDMKAGIVHLSSSMVEEYLPEALNYDLSGVINFKKGCYTGQEIVARMYYRGTAKKRLFHCLHESIPAELKSLNHQANSTMVENEIIQFEKTENGELHLLALLPIAAVEEGVAFYLNQSQQLEVKLQPLAYMA